MFRELLPEGPLPPCFQLQGTAIGDVSFLHGLKPTCHVGVVNQQHQLGIEYERANVGVAGSNRGYLIVTWREAPIRQYFAAGRPCGDLLLNFEIGIFPGITLFA